MPEQKEAQAVEDRVIDAITSGKAKMRSRWYFNLQAILTGTVIAALLLLTLFIVSFIVYVVSESGTWFGVHLGVSGWFVFFMALPWSLLFLSLALILILIVLLKRYAFIYQYPLLYALLGLLVIASLGGSLLAATSFHARVLRYAIMNKTPVIGNLYTFYGTEAASEVHRGIIVSVGTGGFIIRDANNVTSSVVLPPEANPALFTVGSSVIVFGTSGSDGAIHSFGVESVVQ